MVATVLNLSSAATLGSLMQFPPISRPSRSNFQFCTIPSTKHKIHSNHTIQSRVLNKPFCYSDYAPTTTPPPESDPPAANNTPPPIRRRRRRYRKQYPGEKNGITEEMRFVAMKLRNNNAKKGSKKENESDISDEENDDEGVDESDESVSLGEEEDGGGCGEIWQPSMAGFVKYLVDSKHVFETVERIVDESSDVSYAYFRNTGLERSAGLSKDLEWFREQNIEIPECSSPGVTYVSYLEKIAETSPPLFLCHFYNIYFSHIAGGQVIAKQVHHRLSPRFSGPFFFFSLVSRRLLEGRELEFYNWEGDTSELLRGVREKLNMIGEHWTRDEKNKCLRDATKSFRFLGQIVRLIIL
ncbi:hypothetical protein RJ640_020295 [Escallonia rubra]|uniref:Heme oxygenase 2 n=1 Tax=Escallonia rubra TaxID=112253 RepID=A0AA88RMW9_9ASTE|nr:hypothetical protein RJ640_020295 [Escallonia rubra]